MLRAKLTAILSVVASWQHRVRLEPARRPVLAVKCLN